MEIILFDGSATFVLILFDESNLNRRSQIMRRALSHHTTSYTCTAKLAFRSNSLKLLTRGSLNISILLLLKMIFEKHLSRLPFTQIRTLCGKSGRLNS